MTHSFSIVSVYEQENKLVSCSASFQTLDSIVVNDNNIFTFTATTLSKEWILVVSFTF